MWEELKQWIPEVIVEGADQQGANLLVAVKKEKVLELTAEKVEKAAFSSAITTWLFEFLMDSSRVRASLPFFFFLGFFLSLGFQRYHALITTYAASETNHHPPPSDTIYHQRRARRA